MKKSYESLFVNIVKFEAQDVITASGVCFCETGRENCNNETCHIYNPNPPKNHVCASDIFPDA